MIRQKLFTRTELHNACFKTISQHLETNRAEYNFALLRRKKCKLYLTQNQATTYLNRKLQNFSKSADYILKFYEFSQALGRLYHTTLNNLWKII